MDNRIPHMSHPDHMLVLSAQWTEQQKPLDCKVCSKPISPGTPYYICENTDCKFTLHQSCSKLPGVATLKSETEQKLGAEEKAVNGNDQDTNPATKSGDFGTEEKEDMKNGETSNVEANDGESKRGDILQQLPLPSNKVEGEGGNNLVTTKPAAENKIKQLHPKMMQKLKTNQKMNQNDDDESDDDEFDDDEFDDDESEDESLKKSDMRFSDLGGIRNVLEELKKEVIVRLNNPLLLRNLGVKPVSGILLHGPPGCGKTKLAHAIANETALPFHYISFAKLNSGFSSGPKKLRELFEEAHRTAPSIVFIDEIDKLVKPWNQSLMTQLLTCMDEPNSTSSDSTLGYVFVIGATNKPAAFGPDLRKPGRFDREIVVGFPDENARVEILSVLTRNLALKDSVDLVKLSKLTPKFVGADLEKLVHKAHSLAIKRIIDQRKSEMSVDSNSEEHIDEWWKQPHWLPKLEETQNLCIDMADFEVAAKMIQPASIKLFVPDGPRFSDFGGIKSVLEELKMEVIVHRNNPHLLRNLGVKPVSGILLHGPPGCGKTKLAFAIANETALAFQYISCTKLVSEEFHSAVKQIQNCFAEAYRTAPSIVCIDGIDAIASNREDWYSMRNRQLMTPLLTCIDETNLRSYSTPAYVIVIGITNRLDALDPNLRRPGRLDREIAIGVPDENARVEILSVLTRNLNIESSVDLVKLSRSTPRFVGADLAALVTKAGNLALKRIIDQRKPELSGDSTSEEHIDRDWWKQQHWLPKLEETEKQCIHMADFEEAAKTIQPLIEKGLSAIPDVKWEDVGGLDLLRKEFDRYIIQRIKHPVEYEEFGIDLDTGFLLHGPPGCGKTLIAKAVANEAGANFIHIKGPEILSRYAGQSEQAIRDIFSKARKSAPCVIFFDEVDSLTTKRGERSSHYNNDTIVNQLLIELDGGDKRKGVFVIGATNRLEAMDAAILRPGRFGKSMRVPLPDADGRASILKALSRKKPVDASVNFHAIARMKACENLTGAHLAALIMEAAMAAMDEKLKSSKSCSNSTTPTIKTTHFEQALSSISRYVLDKSILRERELSSIPDVKWEDIGGLDLLRKEFDRYIIRRIKHPETYEEFGIDLDAGFLLHGPPGCGKTLIAKAVANESGANFIHIKGPELLNKYYGESERAVREVFNQARICSPCLLFFDEVDALTAMRGALTNHFGDRVLNQLLIELDGGDKRKGVFVIGATNRRDVIDPAVLRPGRFGKSMYVPLPDADGRASILKALARKKPVDASVDFDAIARMMACENLSGADLAALMNEAAMAAMEEKLINSSNNSSNSTTFTIKATHFKKALPKILQSVSHRSIKLLYHSFVLVELMYILT